MLKSDYRKMALAARAEENPIKSALICKKLTETAEFSLSRKIMIYIPVRHEVDTAQIIATAKEQNKRIYAPVVIDSERMVAREITSDGFIKGAFGIPEPTGEECSDLDLIIAPVVAGGRNLHRVGYGKGYYDRFFKDSEGIFSGLAFECQMFDYISPEKHDIPLDFIVTEKEIYR